MKSIFASRVFWVNVVAIVALIIQQATGSQVVLSTEHQAMALAGINVLLRLITKDAVSITGS